MNERLFVQLEAVYGDGRGHMEHGLIKVVAVLPFFKEVLARQRPESGVAKPNRTQPVPGLTGVTTDAILSSQGGGRNPCPCQNFNNNVVRHCPAGEAFVPGLFVGSRT